MHKPPPDAEQFPKLLVPGLRVLGNYYFNLYLVEGEQASALIEVGVSAVADEVLKQLADLGARPSFLVVTHPHADHSTGLAAFLQKDPLVLVVAAEGAPDFLSHPKAQEAIVIEDRQMTRALEGFGIKPGRPPVDEAPMLSNVLTAKDGDEMDLGGLTLRFMSAAGHSPGTVLVHVPEIGAVMVSDSLGFRYPGRGVFPLFFTGYRDYMDTLERVKALNPSILGVAHQGPVVGAENVAAALDESINAARELRERIVNDPRPLEELAEEIFRQFYVDEMTMYTAENIRNCARLVIKRARETLEDSHGDR